MSGNPPGAAAAPHVTVSAAIDGVTVKLVTALDFVRGVRAIAPVGPCPVPSLLVTRTKYVTPFVRPLRTVLVSPVPVVRAGYQLFGAVEVAVSTM